MRHPGDDSMPRKDRLHTPVKFMPIGMVVIIGLMSEAPDLITGTDLI